MSDLVNIRKLENSEIGKFSKIVQYLVPEPLKKVDKIVETIVSDKNNSIYVAEIDSNLVGIITLTMEPKFIHNAGLVCHFEDLAIVPEYRNKGIGKTIIKNLSDEMKKICYKIIVDGDSALVDTLKECGFEKSSNSMVFEHDKIKISDILKTLKNNDNISFNIHKLKEQDLDNGYIEALSRLTVVDIKDDKMKHHRFESINTNPNYIIHVGEENNDIVGGTTLYIKPKFLERGKLIGHIEDVAVLERFGGKDYGKKIVLSLLETAERLGCIKTILNCDDNLVKWYESMGFEKVKTGMRYPPKNNNLEIN